MLLTASNTLFKLGVRPRAVTTPVRVRSQSGTWGETSAHEDLRPSLRPTPAQVATRATKKVHHFSTVRLRESHRTNTGVTTTKAPPFVASEIWRQARQRAPLPPSLFQGPAPASSAGIKSEQPESLDLDLDPDRRGGPGPEVVDLAGQPPPKSARAIEEQPTPRPESPLAHARRGVPGHNVPPAHIETFPKNYRLSIALPRPGGAQLPSEMITVSARRGGRLAVVADAWHLEHDCHFEWHVAFPQSDIDLGGVRARLGKDGILVIDVPRRR